MNNEMNFYINERGFITRCIGGLKEVVIPTEIQGIIVQGIDTKAFF